MREETGGDGGGDNNNSSSNNNQSSGKNRDRKPSIESAKSLEHVATDEEFVGPEFEEDAYYCYSLAATPSFDDLDGSDSEEILVHWHQDTGEIEEIEEADFQRICASNNSDNGNGNNNNNINNSNVRTTTKGELRRLRARIRDRLLALVRRGEDAALHRSGSLSPSLDSVASELQGLSVEEQERQKAEWSAELARIEDEIQTLREVLASKVRTAHELKRKLGISVWKELSEDVNQGLKNVKESQVFQKTESVFKTTAEKTTSILGGFGSGLSMKIGQMRNSDSFRSLEEKVGSAYENVKGRVTPSRSNSTQSFDEALREAGASRRASAAPSATSPTIPEDRVLS